MRFGRSTRTLAAVGRRLLGDRHDVESDGIASEERLALLNTPAEVSPMEYAPEPANAPGVDPTQLLLTALGRFQRQVNKAESGAPEHLWTDECMQQIIDGIEIAHNNTWHDVKEALTDTARVLQSYEDAGAAKQAVPFLQDAYEILCLMVGDIIVDNVRSGVMNKWRQRYTQALNDLARAGVALVDDDGESAAPAPPANIVRFAQNALAVDQERAFPFGDPDAEFANEVEEADAVNIDMNEGIDAAADTIAAWQAEDDVEDDVEKTNDETEAGEVGVGTGLEMDAEDEYDESIEDEDEEIAGEEEEAEDEEEMEMEYEAGEEEDVDEVVVETEENDGGMLDDDDEPELPALDEVIYEEPVPSPEAPSNIVRLAEPAPLAMAPAPASENHDFLFDAPTQTPRVADAPERIAATVRDPDDDVQSMLRNAQQAMSRGDVANAKVVALQVAVKMAELEVTRAKEALRAAEGRLEDTARAIEIASEAVRRTEAGVQDVEEQIAQREGEFHEKRSQVSGLRDEISVTHDRIAEIEEQIRALQAQRDAEETRASGLNDQLEQGLAAEGRIQADLDMLAQEEEAAREALDAAKQRVRDLQRERLARESDINDSRGALKNQERSVEDIKRTLHQVVAGPDEPAAETGLLF